MAGQELEETEFSAWVGREEAGEDLLTPRLLAEFEATLAPHLFAADAAAPQLVHWALGPRIAPLSELGPDGHPAKGGFLPPVPLPRRMWASGEVEFFDDLRTGDAVNRRSRIAGVQHKTGRTGELWFVEVDHEFATVRGVAVKERQTLVYRAAGTAAAPPPPPQPQGAEGALTFPPVMLMRYSAITFNGHRIHYDHPYAREVEGYAGLVVHGPLQATLLAHAAARAGGRALRLLRYRGVSPLISGEAAEMRLERAGEGWQCRMCKADGTVTMEAWGE